MVVNKRKQQGSIWVGKKKRENKKTSLHCLIKLHIAFTAWALREVLLPSSKGNTEEIIQRMTRNKVTKWVSFQIG